MAIQIQLRRGDAADWTSNNPTLAEGEVGVEIDTLKLKVGNGTDNWNTLPYFGSAGTVTSVGALTLGTSGTDLSSTVANGTTTPVITLNVPTASATNRGVLSSADWTTFNNKGNGTVTSVTGTSPVNSSGGATPAISLASGYGDTLNPYASKTANYVLASPDGSSGIPTFRAIVASDIPTLNQNTTGTAANITATSNSTLTTLSALSLPYSQLSGTVPTWNQNTTGTASNVTGTVAIANGGSGTTTAQGAMNAFAGAVTSGSYLRGNGTNVVMSTIQAADVPTLNQNTTGTASNVTGIVAVANGGTGTATPSLVAGTNITISGSFPNQTINAAGSSLTVKDEGSTLTSAATSIDFTGAGVTATNTGGAVTVAITGGGGGISSADIQEFTSTGTSTWTKPAGAKLVYVLAFGGGSGGGSGRRRAAASTATAAFGGAGGGGGGRTELWIPAVALGSTETVTIGAGGAGGAAQTADDTNGSAGADGGNSSFGAWAVARGSTGGNGGATTSQAGGSSGGALGEVALGSTAYTASGGASASPGSRGGYRPAGGGGAGGFAAASTTTQNGQRGGVGGSLLTTSSATTAGGGTSGGSSGGVGGNGSNSPTYFVGGDGAGGGGSTTTTGGTGGNGGYPGGGGGGGGAGNAVNSGAGGNGGDGYIRVVTFF